jgi:type IV pilus assembly protein PilE
MPPSALTSSTARPGARGFTLIELMVVVAIIGIITAIAYPAYTEYVAKSRRADARSQLLQAAQFMQRFYAANDRYNSNRSGTDNGAGELVPANLTRSPADGAQVYGLSVTATAVAYTVTMVPLPTGSMANDPCGSFILNSAGARSVNGTLSRDVCWK